MGVQAARACVTVDLPPRGISEAGDSAPFIPVIFLIRAARFFATSYQGNNFKNI
jgi:hypothetical protein